MIKGLFKKISVKNAFGKYIDKKSIEKILNGDFENKKPEYKECGYIIFDIIQNDDFENNLKKLLKYSENKDLIIDFYGTVTVCIFQKMGCNKKIDLTIKNMMDEFIVNIPENLLENIRGIYGLENTKVGLFGTNNRISYMALLKNYYEKLLELGKIKYGEMKEINLV